MAPAVKPMVSSSGDRGGVRKSVAVLLILDWNSDDEEFWKALFRIPIMIRPGPTNTAIDTPGRAARLPVIATAKIIM